MVLGGQGADVSGHYRYGEKRKAITRYQNFAFRRVNDEVKKDQFLASDKNTNKHSPRLPCPTPEQLDKICSYTSAVAIDC